MVQRSHAYNYIAHFKDVPQLCPWHPTDILAKNAEGYTIRAALIYESDGLEQVCIPQWQRRV